MTSAYRMVANGLRLSSAGLWLVALSTILMASLALFTNLYIYRSGDRTFAFELMTRNIVYGCLGLIAVGLVIGFVGRCFCMPVPAAAGAAPARIGLAVIFEASSLISAAALITAAFLPLPPLPSYVAPSWIGFIGLTAYLARMQFLRFTRALAEHLAPNLVTEAVAVQRLYLYVPGGFVLAYGIAVASALLRANPTETFYQSCGVLLGWLVATAATLFGLIGVWRWAGLLVGLRKAVTRTSVAVPSDTDDDRDAEYRVRHLERGLDDEQ